MRFDSNGKGAPNYYPNSYSGPQPDPKAAMPPMALTGAAVRSAYVHPNDDFEQTRALYERAMNDTDRAHLVDNIVSHLGKAEVRLQLRQTALFYKVHPEYGLRVAEGLGLDREEVTKLAGLDQPNLVEATVGK